MRHRADLKGRRFDRLEVIDRVEGNPDYVVCKCDCGTTCVIKAVYLTKAYKPTRSCGCLRKETCSDIGKRTITTNTVHQDSMNQKFHTVFQMIEGKKLRKNNTSGHRGVCFDKTHGKFKAYIGLHRKLHNLGLYKTLDEAIAARLDAEEKMYAPLIAEKNACLAAQTCS